MPSGASAENPKPRPGIVNDELGVVPIFELGSAHVEPAGSDARHPASRLGNCLQDSTSRRAIAAVAGLAEHQSAVLRVQALDNRCGLLSDLDAIDHLQQSSLLEPFMKRRRRR